MGLNISGIVINKNLEDNLAELSEILKLKLSFDKEIDFETATQNDKDESILDVYYTEKGTIAFAHIDSIAEENKYPKVKVLTFLVEDAALKFSFNYAENNRSTRYLMELEGELIDDDGEPLAVEARSMHIAETIWKQINKLLGESYWKIEGTEKAYRYHIVGKAELPEQAPSISSPRAQNIPSPTAVEASITVSPLKEASATAATVSNKQARAWWEFWK